MDIAVAQQFLREHENAVLATWRRDGRLQMSPVTVGLDGAGRATIASADTTYKVRNLRRDPRATPPCVSSWRPVLVHGCRLRASPRSSPYQRQWNHSWTIIAAWLANIGWN